MQDIEQAVRRLRAAVDRLEKVSAGESPIVKKLAAELRAARSAYSELQSATSKVSTRLDAAIGRLKTVLD
jgi:hypothetical protein